MLESMQQREADESLSLHQRSSGSSRKSLHEYDEGARPYSQFTQDEIYGGRVGRD